MGTLAKSSLDRLVWLGKALLPALETLCLLEDNRQADPVVLELLLKRNMDHHVLAELDDILGGWSNASDGKKNALY